MRIALISEHASPLAAAGGVDAGGQNIYVAHVARCLAEQGHEVDVFTRWDDPTLEPVVTLAPRVRVVHVSAGPQAFVPKEALLGLMPQFASFCAAWLRRSRPYDVIHANFFMSGWVGLRLKKRFGVPLVTTFHALGRVRREHQQAADAFPDARMDIEQALVAESDAIVAECPQDALDLARLYDADSARIHMIPCGFDAAELSPLPRETARTRLRIAADEFTVLQLGRMVPRKGVETVVRALGLPACRELRLRIVGGDGEVADPIRTPEIGRLMAVAKDCGAAGRVTFEGRKPREELRHWYAASDVFVTTPWYEPFGITPLEAMACARPVIGSRVGGLPYSIDDGTTGLLVPPKDPEALAAAIRTLYADPALGRRMGEAGLRRVRRHFTWDGIAAQLATLYARVVSDASDIVATTELNSSASPRRGRVARRSWTSRAPAIFLDKDGTLVEDVPYNVDPGLLRLTRHAIPALGLLRAHGFRLVVVTNQAGIGLRLFDAPALDHLHRSLGALLARAEVPIDAAFACPHRVDAHCECRKPKPGLLLHAAKTLDIDLRRSWMIGDILNDVEAGHRAGCRTILLDVGHETEWIGGPARTPDYRCADLLQAAQWILQRDRVDRLAARSVAPTEVIA